MRFQDQAAIVTGSASGIGLATAIRMASEGAKVVLADLDAAGLLVRDVGKPENVAAAIAFLASPEATFIQGATLRIDGGRLNRL